MKFLPLILKNAFRKKTRTLLTIGSIVLPLLVICVMGTFLRALDRPDPAATRGMFRLVTRHKVSLSNFLPHAYLDKIRRLPGVVAATELDWFGGKYGDGSAKTIFSRFAVEPEAFFQVFDDAVIQSGSAADWYADRAGCIVGANLAEKLHLRVGDKVVLLGDIWPVTLELNVRAIYQLPDGNASSLHFNRKYLEEASPRFGSTLGMVWIKAQDGKAATSLIDTIDGMFENSPYPTKTETEKAFQMSFMSLVGNVKLLVTSIGVIIVAVILLIAANTMAMAARERVTEIAVLRTLGYQRRTILGLILGESVLVSVFGGLVGVAVFSLIEPTIRRGIMTTPLGTFASGFNLYPGVLLFAFLVAVGVGLLAGVVPAITSAQRSITDGLRQVA